MGLAGYVLTVGALGATLVGGVGNGRYGNWVGVWQGELNGQPAVTVTLGQDAGDLEGTIVFDMLSREGGEAHLIGHDAHVLIHMRVDGRGLQFDVIRRSDAKELHWAMWAAGEDEAVLECSDCDGPPTVPLLRTR